jgi:hypothetical protein
MMYIRYRSYTCSQGVRIRPAELCEEELNPGQIEGKCLQRQRLQRHKIHQTASLKLLPTR